MKRKIKPKTKISKIVSESPEAVGELMEIGMGCAMCPMAEDETLEQGCLSHGMTKKEIAELIKKINKGGE